jgi:hypothetical protein
MQLSDLWNLMETPQEERSFFDHVTCHISAAVDEVTADGALALDLIEQVSLIPLFALYILVISVVNLQWNCNHLIRASLPC